MNNRADKIEIRVGRHRVELDEEECRLLKEIRAGRAREVRHITNSRALTTLLREHLVNKHKGPWRFDSRSLARTGVAMAQQEVVHLTSFGTNCFLELERIEREQQQS